MEKCSNCGGAVRPGAKFCTSCGTRLNDAQPAPETAPTPAPEPEQSAPAEETQAAAPAAPAESDPYATWRAPETNNDWRAAAAAKSENVASSPNDQAETEPTSAPEGSGEETSSTYRPVTWGEPVSQDSGSDDEDRFASWASAYSSYQQETGNTSPETAEASDQTAEPVVAGASTTEPAPASNDVIIESAIEDSEARQRASKLVDELRGLIWQIGLTERTDGDENMAKITLAGARGQTGEFSDITRALDELANDPRDIDALRALGAKSDRIRELMNSHSRLLSAIDEAIDEIR